jgi:hypothetical protein
MKKYLFALLMMCCNCSTSSFAQDKTYINSSDVIIGVNGIFVKVNECVFQTQNISFDDQGVFVSGITAWKCPECDREFPKYQKDCPWHPKEKN